MPEVMLENFVVKSQINHTACWAAATAAVANFVKKTTHSQEDLLAKFKTQMSDRGGLKVSTALSGLAFAPVEIPVAGNDKDFILDSIRASLDAQKPVVAGIKVATGTLWYRKKSPIHQVFIDSQSQGGKDVPKIRTGQFRMPHAVVICGYDEANFFYQDSARKDDTAQKIPSDKLFSGFIYMDMADLGIRTRMKLSQTVDSSDSPEDMQGGALLMVLDSITTV